jgi:hypothetical protein
MNHHKKIKNKIKKLRPFKIVQAEDGGILVSERYKIS